MTGNMIAILEGHDPEELGLLPDMIDQDDPRPAAEQFDANYAHGGGWRPMQKFIHKGLVLYYPGDPPFRPIASWPLRHELIVVYRHGFVAVFNTEDWSFQVARLD